MEPSLGDIPNTLPYPAPPVKTSGLGPITLCSCLGAERKGRTRHTQARLPSHPPMTLHLQTLTKVAPMIWPASCHYLPYPEPQQGKSCPAGLACLLPALLHTAENSCSLAQDEEHLLLTAAGPCLNYPFSSFSAPPSPLPHSTASCRKPSWPTATRGSKASPGVLSPGRNLFPHPLLDPHNHRRAGSGMKRLSHK